MLIELCHFAGNFGVWIIFSLVSPDVVHKFMNFDVHVPNDSA